MRKIGFLGSSLLTSISVLLFVALASDAIAAQPSRGDLTIDPLSIVILIDESGSLGQTDVDEEARAAALLASIEVSDASSVAVLGFGSSGQGDVLAVRDYCMGLQRLDSVGARERVEECASQAKRRPTAEAGNNTDHYSALRKALDVLKQSPAGSRRAIFLLTDGVLDPGPFSNLGDGDRELATRRAAELIRTEIGPEAKQLGVQIWPLGFGPEVDRKALSEYASLGAGANSACENFGRDPEAAVVPSVTDVLNALLQAAANARCQAFTEGTGGSDATVEISRFATDGTVAVTRPPGTAVTFTAPDGTKLVAGQPAPKGSGYTIIDTKQAVAVRFQGVEGGRWTVTSAASAPPVAVWEARIETMVSAREQASPGETVKIDVLARNRNGFISDFGDAELKAFQLRVKERGGQPVVRSDVQLDDDGSLSATFTMPTKCPATVEVDADFRILGFVDASEPIQVVCDQSTGFAVELESPCVDLRPGGVVPVDVTYSNRSGVPRRISIGIENAQPAGWEMRGESVFEVDSGDNDTKRAEIAYAGAHRGGKFTGWIVATDITSGATVKTKSILCGTFVGPPPPWRLILVGTALATFLVWLLARSNRANSLRTTEGLTIQLVSGGRILAEEFGEGRIFDFSVVDRPRSGPTIEIDEDGHNTYSIARRLAGSFWPRRRGLLLTQDGEREEHTPPIVLSTGLRYRGRRVEIEIHDNFSESVDDELDDMDDLADDQGGDGRNTED